jgi:hypothetical protein
MAETSSQDQAAWAADLESQIGMIRASVESDSPGAWLAGVLERGLAATAAEVTGHGGPQPTPMAPTHNSVTWCQSRFVCISMRCGGSSWC